jgi:hypothetical protein
MMLLPEIDHEQVYDLPMVIQGKAPCAAPGTVNC